MRSRVASLSRCRATKPLEKQLQHFFPFSKEYFYSIIWNILSQCLPFYFMTCLQFTLTRSFVCWAHSMGDKRRNRFFVCFNEYQSIPVYNEHDKRGIKYHMCGVHETGQYYVLIYVNSTSNHSPDDDDYVCVFVRWIIIII